MNSIKENNAEDTSEMSKPPTDKLPLEYYDHTLEEVSDDEDRTVEEEETKEENVEQRDASDVSNTSIASDAQKDDNEEEEEEVLRGMIPARKHRPVVSNPYQDLQ